MLRHTGQSLKCGAAVTLSPAPRNLVGGRRDLGVVTAPTTARQRPFCGCKIRRTLKKPASADDGPAQEVLMSISSISSSSSTSDIQAVTPSAVSPASPLTSANATSGVNVDISKPGQLFSDLSSLAETDPDKFKAVTADIAQKLKTAAGSATGSQADTLNKIADRFQAAAQSGNASDLAPPSAGKAQGGGHHHHGHHRGHSGGGGGGDAIAQTVQGIISGALGSSSSSSSSPTATAPVAASPTGAISTD
jgi:hypothetical protein